MKNKLITCKYCGNEIASKAKVCPQCGGKNKKPIYKRKSVWFLVILLLIIIGVGGSGDDKPQKVGTVDSNKGEEQTEKLEQTEFKVGDVLKDGDMKITYVASGNYTSDNQFSQPKDGYHYIFLEFIFENTSKKSNDSISFYSFDCFADDYACEMYYGGDDDLSATLTPGRATTGLVYFEVPNDAKNIIVEYETNIFTDEKITFIYEGEKTSDYRAPANTNKTEGAFAVGDIVEGKDIKLTYVRCFDDQSNNMFIKPKAGYKYITLEFEAENLSKSDQLVSYFDFKCYADGFSCDSSYFRDDQISATLSAGKKAKGTVTFEVPSNASVIEVDYISNYFTSDSITFIAK